MNKKEPKKYDCNMFDETKKAEQKEKQFCRRWRYE